MVGSLQPPKARRFCSRNSTVAPARKATDPWTKVILLTEVGELPN